VVFDHLEEGTPESCWQASALASLLKIEAPGPGARLLVVAAHPDDESLGVGGLIAAATAGGAIVDLLIATDGEGSHPRSTTQTPQALGQRRRSECTRALAVLSPTIRPVFLGMSDGDLQHHKSQLIDEISHRAAGYSHVLSPWSADGHPDHEACGEAVRIALRGRYGVTYWQYPIWAWHWADPGSSDLPWDRLVRFDIGGAAKCAKEDALGCYQSQIKSLSDLLGDEAVLGPYVLSHFQRDFEVVITEPNEPSAGEGAYFDALYTASPDPWGLEERFYEKRKRDVVIASLPRLRFRRAFEPGCATGLLTEQLGDRCAEVVAWDGAELALRQARERLRGSDAFHLEHRRIPADWPAGEFDLVVLSEVAYYCADLDQLVQRTIGSLSSDGVVVGCHWRRPAPDHPLTAEQVHAAISASPLRRVVHHEEEDFLLDVWTRTGQSVACAEGLLA
jgi:LmbE family N-acetylglucosaminyl deacetylase/SAM-dependent methyltransferase